VEQYRSGYAPRLATMYSGRADDRLDLASGWKLSAWARTGIARQGRAGWPRLLRAAVASFGCCTFQLYGDGMNESGRPGVMFQPSVPSELRARLAGNLDRQWLVYHRERRRHSTIVGNEPQGAGIHQRHSARYVTGVCGSAVHRARPRVFRHRRDGLPGPSAEVHDGDTAVNEKLERVSPADCW
jgi:hypothetical protein